MSDVLHLRRPRAAAGGAHRYVVMSLTGHTEAGMRARTLWYVYDRLYCWRRVGRLVGARAEKRARTLAADLNGTRHGTDYRYLIGCRCRACRRAHDERQRRSHENSRGRCVDCGNPTSWPGHGRRTQRCWACYVARRITPHGTRGRYQQGCRCDDCREAHSAYLRAWRARQ